MRHNKTTKAVALLMSMTMITSVFVGNTLSRYVTSVSSTDNARVAVWGINSGEDTTMNLFSEDYIVAGKTIAASNVDGEKIMAPGTAGEAEFEIINFEQNVAPEVAYEVKITLDDSAIADEIKNNPSVQWKLDNGAYGTWDQLKTAILSLAGNESGRHVYEPGQFATAFQGTQIHKIAWQWVMDNSNNVMDTQMGNLALTNELEAVISVSITAQQIDDLVTNENMLEGANQTVNLQDVQTLSFRSASDIANFQRVEVNGQPITEGTDYTKTSGSTIITLTESYIAKLGTNRYVIDIISTDMTASTVFEVVDVVVKPEISSILSENSWETISSVVRSGKASDYWSVGDKTTVKVNGVDKEVVIIGMNHDGDNTITFAFNEILSEFSVMDQDEFSSGWIGSDMRESTILTILNQMENKDLIKEVEKKTITGYYSGGDNFALLCTTNDKLFLLSYTEVFGGNWNEGTQYEYFKNRNNRAIKSNMYGEFGWWLRTPSEFNDYSYFIVDSFGDESTNLTNESSNGIGVVPAFVIG